MGSTTKAATKIASTAPPTTNMTDNTVTANGNTTTVPTTTTTTTDSPTTTEEYITTTPSLNTTVMSPRDGKNSSMGTGGIVGIIAGVCLVLFVIFLVLFILYRRSRKPNRPIDPPTLPSKEDVDHTIYKLTLQNESFPSESAHMTQTTTDTKPESPYTNLDGLGNPNEETNPSVGDDGYLKKTSQGIDYMGDGKKKGKKKKKIKDKFKKNKGEKYKLHKSGTEEKPDAMTRNEPGSENSASSHQYVNRMKSDADYSQGRTAHRVSDVDYSLGRTVDTPEEGYSEAKESPRNPKKKKHKLYENMGTTESKYANITTMENKANSVDGQNYYNLKQNNDEGPTEIYENT